MRTTAGKVFARAMEEDLIGNAAQAAFYFVFALFPLLLFLTSIFGVILEDQQGLQDQLFTMLRQVMPSSAVTLVEDTLEEVTSNASGGKLTFGIFLTLYSASAGIDNMRGTLNQVYRLTETRSWWKAKAVSFLLTLAVGILTLLALSAIVYGHALLDQYLPIDSQYLLQPLSWIITLVLILFALALIYNFAPDHDPFEWKWITPGAVVALAIWLVVSAGFRVYLHFFNSYSATYGSLGAMIILLLWLYLTALAILLGGAINAVLDEKSGVKSKSAEAK